MANEGSDDPSCGIVHVTRRTGIVAAVSAWLSGGSSGGVLNALASSNGSTSQEGIAYGPDPRHRLDTYLPLTVEGAAPPILVFFYGGSWSRGNRADYRFVGETLASRGVIVVVADYRLTPAVRYPGFLEDCAAAVKWTFDHAAELGGSPANVVVMGHSAGAYNAAMLALDQRWLRGAGVGEDRKLAGWIGLAGPYDFLPIHDHSAQVAFDWPNTPRDSQPVEHVTPRAPRALLLAAAKDDLVDPQRSTVGLAVLLRSAGVPVALRLYERVNHVTLLAALVKPLDWLAPVRSEVLAFLGLPGNR